MAQRRPIATHPAFALFVAVWFAALFGLAMAVLPAGIIAAILAAAGLEGLGNTGPVAAIIVATVVGAIIGLLIGKSLARRAGSDPRPVYAEPEAEYEDPAPLERKRRPLSIREELTESLAEDVKTGVVDSDGQNDTARLGQDSAEAGHASEVMDPPSSLAREIGEDFLILSPQPAHPPRPAPDLDSLLSQFDTALAAFRGDDDQGEEGGQGTQDEVTDPVQAFVARQTTPITHAPLGGTMPDHQAELRSALDKLARARGSEPG